ncbi:3-dehydroquinate synthase [Paraclostridium ghonii]|uniref:3-dehydroquinate synthase n=1 Tax=Paraclostridium ghonii TaxID=29358 RepID=A0ABU0MW00_9FIRM|nr:3-dehydroquinate synthase [Paeniclostridium ghonii]MDQ0554934.1 3-dehydroquinate synthase [Paeniclostridium ghonii]
MEKCIKIEYDYNSFKLKDKHDKVLIITDENVNKYQFEDFKKALNHKFVEVFIINSGENSKSLNVYEKIIKFCIEVGITRKSVLIALGGGVVGDLAGFVASTYMRGIDLVQVPTTLLSQVDSSVGGKTGINIGNIKNIVGTFYQPKLTYINVNSLKTLGESEYLSGLAEVLKYSFIYDYEFLNYIVDNSKGILSRNEDVLSYIIKKCTDIKWEVVSKDEKENGLRKILNLGHTFGHGIEKLCGLSHGFAVNIGTNMAFNLALDKGFIDNEYYQKFIYVSNLLNIPISFKYESPEEILNLMKSDKKNSFGNINLVIPVGRGKVEVFDNIKDNEILNVIKRCINA